MARRVYRVPLVALTVSATQDIVAITTTASIPARLEEIRLDPLATSGALLNLAIALFTGSFTAGSGGATATPVIDDNSDAAASSTVKTQNTTLTAVGTGTKTNKDAGSWNSSFPWVWQPIDSDHRLLLPVSACLAVQLNTVPSSSTLNGCVIFSEGG